MKKIRGHQLFVAKFAIWIRLLFQNKTPDKNHIPTIIRITVLTLLLSPLLFIDSLINFFRIKYQIVKSPIFIIGHWRSGTTFLHYLLALDPQFGYLTYYQSFVPGITLIGGDWLKKILRPLLPYKRPQDNVELAADLPAEEENSIATLTTRSPIHSWFFPKNEDYFHRFATMKDLSKSQHIKWKEDYFKFLNKVSYLNEFRQLIIKNPFNTARIKSLLEIFPDAKFIFLNRDPTDIFPSTFLMYDMVVKTQFLQDFREDDMKSMILRFYKSIMDNYLEQRKFIPRKNLIEIPFEVFEKEPMECLEKIYQQFQLDDFEEVKDKFLSYLKQKKGYQKNRHVVSEEDMNRMKQEWSYFYKVFNYPIPEYAEEAIDR